MAIIQLTPEAIKDPRYEGIFINRLNKEKALEDMEARFDKLQLIAQHNIILAAKCIIACFLRQKKEKKYLIALAQQQVQDYTQPDLSATAFIALAKLGAWAEVSEQYYLLKQLSPQQKKQLTPSYLHYLKYNGFEQEQSFLFTMLINLATSFKEAEDFFYAMEMQHVLPNTYSYGSVINKATTWETAQFWFQKAAIAGFSNDLAHYNILIKITKDFNTAKELFIELQEKGLKPDAYTFASLLSKCKTLEDGRLLLGEMRANNVTPNEITYTNLLQLCKTLEEGKMLLDEMRANNVTPNEITYNSLLKLCKTLDKGRLLLGEMRANNVTPNEITYNSLLQLCKTLEEGRLLLGEMRANNVTPDEYTYNPLLSQFTTLEEGRLLLGEMRANNVTPNEYTFSSLLQLCKTLEDGRLLLDEMRANNVTPNEYTFSSLLKLCTTFEEGRLLLGEMRANNVTPNEITYNSLLKLCKTLEDGRLLLGEMRANNITPNEYTYTSLITLAKVYQDVLFGVDEMRRNGFKLNQIHWNLLIKKSPNFEVAWDNYQLLLSEGYMPDLQTFMPLLTKCITLETFQKILVALQQYDILPDDFMQQIFVSKVLNFLPDNSYLEALIGQATTIAWKSFFERLNNEYLKHQQARLKVGDVVSCKVTTVSRNRLEVRVANETRRCSIHIKYLNWKVIDLQQEIRKGQEFHNAKVISIDPKYGINLSLLETRALSIGEKVACTVTGFNPQGTVIFVKVDNDTRRATLYIKHLDKWYSDIKAAFPIGKVFTAKVINLNEQYGIGLSLKED